MKSILSVCFILVNFFSIDAINEQRKSNFKTGEDVILTFNKCGTHFCLYNLQYLTGRPFKNIGSAGFLHFHTGLKVSNLSPIYHTHTPQRIPRHDSVRSLIVIVRNPVELILRFFGYEQGKILLEVLLNTYTGTIPNSVSFPVKEYETGRPFSQALDHIRLLVDIFQFYDNYKGKKILMYYEDLVECPKLFMERILNFLEEDASKLNEFENNLDYIKEECLNAYVKQFNSPKELVTTSNGNDPIYYQKIYSDEEKKTIEDLIIQLFPQKCLKYIERFYVKDDRINILNS